MQYLGILKRNWQAAAVQGFTQRRYWLCDQFLPALKKVFAIAPTTPSHICSHSLLWRHRKQLFRSALAVLQHFFLKPYTGFKHTQPYLEYSPLLSDNYRPRPPSVAVGKTSFILGGGRLRQSSTTYLIPRFSVLQRQSHFIPKRREHGRYRRRAGVRF